MASFLEFITEHGAKFKIDFKTECNQLLALGSWDLTQGLNIWSIVCHNETWGRTEENLKRFAASIPYTKDSVAKFNAEFGTSIYPLGLLDSFEAQIGAKSSTILDFSTYLSFVQSKDCKLPAQNKISLCRVLFERCITKFPHEESVWSEYLKYLRKDLNLAQIVLAVSERAIRDCPWSVRLRTIHFLNLEQHRRSEDVPRAYKEASLFFQNAAMEEQVLLISSYLDWVRRNESDKNQLQVEFQDALNRIQMKFPEGDPYCRLERYFANAMVNWTHS